jgi:hypothetical protein
MYTTINAKHIRLLYQPETLSSSRLSSTEPKITKEDWDGLLKRVGKNIVWYAARWINEAWAFFWLIGSKLIAANGIDAINKVIKEEKWLNENQKQTIYALYEIGEIWYDQVGSALNRGWQKSSAIKDAIDKGITEPYIMTYSNNEYRAVSISEYKKETDGKPEKLNINIIQWILKTAVNTRNGQIYGKYLTHETLKSLAIYLQSRNYNSRLIPQGIDVKVMMEKLAEERKQEISAKINPLIAHIREKQKNNPEFTKILNTTSASIGVKFDAAGRVDVNSILEFAKSGIENKDWVDAIKLLIDSIEKKIQELKRRITELNIQSKETIRTSLWWNASIQWIFPEHEEKFKKIRKNPLVVPCDQLSKTQAEELLKIISDIPRDNLNEKQRAIIKILIIQKEKEETRIIIASTQRVSTLTKTGEIKVQKSPQWNIQILPLSKVNASSIQKSGEIGAQRWIIEDIWESLQSKGIQDISDASKELERIKLIQRNRPLSPEEIQLQGILENYLEQNTKLSQIYVQSVKELWKKEAQEIFIEANQVISWKSREVYNFTQLEKNGILTDNESTDLEKQIAIRNVGDILPINLITENISEARSIELWKKYPVIIGEDGLLYIKDKSNNIISNKWLHPDKVEGFYRQIDLFDSVWLGSLISHLEKINQIVGRKLNFNIDNRDGTYTFEEGNKMLKFLASIVFEEVSLPNIPIDQMPRVYKSEYASNQVNNPELYIRWKLLKMRLLDQSWKLNISEWEKITSTG